MAKKIGENEASSSRSRGESVVFDHGRRRSTCGYCKSSGYTNISHGLWARSLTVNDYQDLLDRGWRRSGSFLYKPEMERTCCPSYTIRLKANDFNPSKEQSRVHRRMEKYLDGMLNVKKPDHVEDQPKFSRIVGAESVVEESSANNSNNISNTEEYIAYLSSKIDNAVRACVQRGELPSVQLPKTIVKMVTPQTKKKMTEICGDLLYTSNISFQIAAALRRSQSAENNICQSDLSRNIHSLDLSPKGIAEKLARILDKEALSGLTIKACNGHLNFYSSTNEIASAEDAIAIDASIQSSRCSRANAKCGGVLDYQIVPPHKKRRLEIRMKRSSFEAEEYALYRRYQIRVHDDKPEEVMESSYRRFLVDTPLIFVPPSGDGSVPLSGFGSFHQQYVIDGKLVAVGVVDVLPRCLSSKYLFWDPDLAFLSLGKYTALQEIGWVKENQVHCPSLEYYYLGYYIHSCSKMRYKAAYRPSELLCPLRYEWVPFDIAKPLIDKKPYVVFSNFKSLQNEASPHSRVSERPIEQPYVKSSQQNQGEALEDTDEETEPDYTGSDRGFDDDSGPEETSSLTSVDELMDGDVGSLTLDRWGTRLKFKDLQKMVRASQRKHIGLLEQQLHRYRRVVGKELFERMIFTLN